jgi:hypothetical protein
MEITWRPSLRRSFPTLVLTAFFCGSALAQQPVLTARNHPIADNDSLKSNSLKNNLPSTPESNTGTATVTTPFATTTTPALPARHRFWDKENTILFSATAASATADFFVTRMNLQNGGRELNPIVRPFTGSTPLLAMNFVGETAGVIGLCYFFHKTEHHRLERLTSMVNISASGFGVTYGLTHR